MKKFHHKFQTIHPLMIQNINTTVKGGGKKGKKKHKVKH